MGKLCTDTTIGAKFVIPSTFTYEGTIYIVTSFNDIIGYTDNGKGKANFGNHILTHVYIPGTLVTIPDSAFQNCHAVTEGLRFDVFDLRNATSIADDAFFYAYGGNTMIIYAEQAKYFNANSIRRLSSSYYNPETDNDGTFIIYGGKTPETARTLGGPIWTADIYHWHGSTVFMNFYIKGYVNAYDGIDGLIRQNGYGIDQVDYFFESEEAFVHYIASIANTTEKNTTYTRYAQNSMGYFNVCQGNGTTKAYNLTYTDSVPTIVEVTNANYIKSPITHTVILDGKCTASTCCMVCDYELTKGLDHDLKAVIAYANGYAA